MVVILAVLGLCFGSFVNALVWRMHERQKTNNKKQITKNNQLSIIHGRSMCPHCHHTLAWYDLLPVVSWLSLKGRCRYCHKPIGWQYPIVEITTALTFIISYLYWPYGFDAAGITLLVFWLAILVGFMALTVYDLRWFMLPDKIVFPITGLGVLAIVLYVIIAGSPGYLIDPLVGGLSLFGLFYALFHASKGTWIGGGDVKLAFLLGLLAGGFLESMLLLFVASIIGTAISLPFLVIKKLKAKSQIPFGPLLIMATFIVYLFGISLLDWLRVEYFYY